MKNVDLLEIVDKPGVLGLALLEEFVFIEDGFEGDVFLVEETVDVGRIMESKSGRGAEANS